MGVAYLYGGWVAQGDTLEALREELPLDISSLSIDFNALVYISLQIVLGIGGFKDKAKEISALESSKEAIEAQIIKITVDIMVSIAYFVQPKDTLIVALDGPVPLGKIQQQKGRRYKPSEGSDISKLFDKRSITPGTAFMDALNLAVETRLETLASDIGCKTIIFSPSTEEGEGEHKIFNYYREGLVEGEGSHVIYGMDADLIILCLASGKKDLILARESIGAIVQDRAGQNIDIRGTDKWGNAITGKNIHIDQLKTIILNKMGGGPIEDFALVTSIIGNDFLPHPTSTLLVKEAMDNIMKAYKKNDQDLTTKVDGMIAINWGAFKDFLDIFTKNEGRDIANFYGSKRMKGDKSRFYRASASKKGMNMMKYRSAWYSNAVGGDQDKIVDMSIQFMYGMAWALSYYVDGHDAVTWLWSYPYNHAPMLNDMRKVLGQLLDQDIEEVFDTRPIEEEARFTSAHQLIAVIPYESLDIIPEELQPMWADDSPLFDLMPTEFVIEQDEAISEWQGIPILPKADYERIMDAVYNMEFTDQEWQAYVPRQGTIFTITDQEAEEAHNKLKPRPKPIPSRTKGRGSYSRGSRGSKPSSRGSRGSKPSSRGSKPSSRGSRGSKPSSRGSRGSKPSSRGSQSKCTFGRAKW